MNKKTNKKIMLWIPMVIAPIATISTVVSCSVGTNAKLTEAAEKLKNEMNGFKIKLSAKELTRFNQIIKIYNKVNNLVIDDGIDSNLPKTKNPLSLSMFNYYKDMLKAKPDAKEMYKLNSEGKTDLIKSIFDKLKVKLVKIDNELNLGLEKHFKTFDIDLNDSGDKYALTIHWKDGITISDGITITITK